MLRVIFSFTILLWAGAASAQSVALILGTEDYERLSDVGRGDDVVETAGDLQRAGIRVVARRAPTNQQMRQALSEFGQMVDGSDRLLVTLSGRFVHSATETYYLPADGDTGPLATLASNSLPLSTVFAWLADKPGKAVLVLATDRVDAKYGRHLTAGAAALNVPQGVLVVRLGSRGAQRFLEDGIARPGIDMVAFARKAGFGVQGYTAPGQVFVTQAARPSKEVESAASARQRDIRAWRKADTENTAEAYQGYLEAFPGGEFRRMARNRIQALTDTPEARAQRAEQALALNRDQRRDIQRNLSLLDFSTRGIDGIFGRGTRAAIAAWQKREGYRATGFLSREQIDLLDAQAEQRAIALEEEAERRRAELVAADTAFWNETGARGDEAGYRVYLGRYPDGEYSDIARTELNRFERQKRRQTNNLDRALWDRAAQINSVAAYEDYLSRAPNGAFREEAETRIASIGQAQRNSQAVNAAQREEAALNLSPRTRKVIEGRLEALGLNPGKVDGVLDQNSRRAIRNYQTARKMPVTGFLSEKVVVQLLADSVRQIFR